MGERELIARRPRNSLKLAEQRAKAAADTKADLAAQYARVTAARQQDELADQVLATMPSVVGKEPPAVRMKLSHFMAKHGLGLTQAMHQINTGVLEAHKLPGSNRWYVSVEAELDWLRRVKRGKEAQGNVPTDGERWPKRPSRKSKG